MIQVTPDIRVVSVRMQGSWCLYRTFVEKDGKRVTDCGFTRDFETHEAYVAQVVRRYLGLHEPSTAVIPTLAMGIVSAIARLLSW